MVISPCKVRKIFSPSIIRMGSRGTFMLCTASSRCTRIAGPGGNETTDCAGLAQPLALSCMPTQSFLKVKTGTAMAGRAVVAPMALICSMQIRLGHGISCHMR